MRSLVKYIRECDAIGNAANIAPSIGDMKAASAFMTPGKVMGMGDPKPPTAKEPGSGDVFGLTRKDKKRTKK